MTPSPLLSIFTASVGFHQAGHTLPDKLRAISQAGFRGVEIFQDDLDAFASSDEFAAIYKALTPPSSPHALARGLSSSTTTTNSSSTNESTNSSSTATTSAARTAWNAHGPCTPFEAQREVVCASYVAGLCASLDLQVLSLQPMRDVEGWLDEAQRKAAFERVRSRFPVMRALGTDLLLCCSNCQSAEQTTGDVQRAADDFAALADEAAAYQVANDALGVTTSDKSTMPTLLPPPPPLRIAFEGLSWGTHIDRWDQAYAVVQRVNRANFGLCLDSFNTLGRQYADPCSVTGVQEPHEETLARLYASLDDLTRVPADKIFFLQVGDARKLAQPLAPSPNADEPRPSRMIWSRGNRLYPGEQSRGAFMPTTDFVKAAVKSGYAGPWSIEVFNESLLQPGHDVQQSHAQRAFTGLRWLVGQVYIK